MVFISEMLQKAQIGQHEESEQLRQLHLKSTELARKHDVDEKIRAMSLYSSDHDQRPHTQQ